MSSPQSVQVADPWPPTAPLRPSQVAVSPLLAWTGAPRPSVTFARARPAANARALSTVGRRRPDPVHELVEGQRLHVTSVRLPTCPS